MIEQRRLILLDFLVKLKIIREKRTDQGRLIQFDHAGYLEAILSGIEIKPPRKKRKA